MCRRHFNKWKKTRVSDEWKVYEHQNNEQELNKLDAAPEYLWCVAVGCCRYMIVGCRQMCARHYKKWKKNHEADDDDNVGADESSQQSSSDKGQAAPLLKHIYFDEFSMDGAFFSDGVSPRARIKVTDKKSRAN
jgi:hypothetical protein